MREERNDFFLGAGERRKEQGKGSVEKKKKPQERKRGKKKAM